MTESRDVVPWTTDMLTGLCQVAVSEEVRADAAALASRLSRADYSPVVVPLLQAMKDAAAVGQPQQATVLPGKLRTSAPFAACLNALAASFPLEDEVVVPALYASLAVAELERASVAHWLDAFAIGAAVAIRLSRGWSDLKVRPYIPASAVGQFAGALATSRLLGLDREKTGHALGLASVQVAGTAKPGTWARAYAVGNSARVAVEVGLIARLGAIGPLDGVRAIGLMIAAPGLDETLKDLESELAGHGGKTRTSAAVVVDPLIAKLLH